MNLELMIFGQAKEAGTGRSVTHTEYTRTFIQQCHNLGNPLGPG